MYSEAAFPKQSQAYRMSRTINREPVTTTFGDKLHHTNTTQEPVNRNHNYIKKEYTEDVITQATHTEQYTDLKHLKLLKLRPW
jgi:hypothetical protein